MKLFSMKVMARALSSPNLFRKAGVVGRWLLFYAPLSMNNKFNAWYKQRNMPEAPRQSFGEWYAKNKSK